MHVPCPFCAVEPTRMVARNDRAFAIRDGYPVSPGHTLVIPFRHVASWFEARLAEGRETAPDKPARARKGDVAERRRKRKRQRAARKKARRKKRGR